MDDAYSVWSLRKRPEVEVSFSKGSSRTGLPFPSPNGRKRSSFPKAVLFSYLEFLAMDIDGKPGDSEY
jgi:hypothetical protein